MRGLDPRIPIGTEDAKSVAAGIAGAGGDARVKPGHDVKSSPGMTWSRARA
jgi:hypothetical protein